MAQLEKSTITISSAAAVLIAILSIGGSILGNFWATRSAVQLELNQIKNDIKFETSLREGGDRILDLRIDNINDRLTRPKEVGATTAYRYGTR